MDKIETIQIEDYFSSQLGEKINIHEINGTFWQKLLEKFPFVDTKIDPSLVGEATRLFEFDITPEEEIETLRLLMYPSWVIKFLELSGLDVEKENITEENVFTVGDEKKVKMLKCVMKYMKDFAKISEKVEEIFNYKILEDLDGKKGILEKDIKEMQKKIMELELHRDQELQLVKQLKKRNDEIENRVSRLEEENKVLQKKLALQKIQKEEVFEEGSKLQEILKKERMLLREVKKEIISHLIPGKKNERRRIYETEKAQSLLQGLTKRLNGLLRRCYEIEKETDSLEIGHCCHKHDDKKTRMKHHVKQAEKMVKQFQHIFMTLKTDLDKFDSEFKSKMDEVKDGWTIMTIEEAEKVDPRVQSTAEDALPPLQNELERLDEVQSAVIEKVSEVLCLAHEGMHSKKSFFKSVVRCSRRKLL
eukprot:snap_masked-scaffold_4-processed-gene-2.16-mRNA-1 protein AED:1.00 eAED:1.00 QI:0/-1/0/0/-1/1/1/0/418